MSVGTGASCRGSSVQGTILALITKIIPNSGCHSAGLEGQGKTSREDFDKILGSTHYAEPKVAEDVAKMLQSVAKVAEKLAGDKPYIASIGYSLASDLMAKMDRQIVVNIKRTDRL